jgi:hypothetical protein
MSPRELELNDMISLLESVLETSETQTNKSSQESGCSFLLFADSLKNINKKSDEDQ